jgi:transcriptional regulator with XRE-family HTH domain
LNTISKNLKTLRCSRKMAMKSVAQAIDVPITTYREWEYGRAIRGEHLIKLAKFFGISSEELVGHESEKSLTTEQRVRRALYDLSIVHSEIKNQKK